MKKSKINKLFDECKREICRRTYRSGKYSKCDLVCPTLLKDKKELGSAFYVGTDWNKYEKRLCENCEALNRLKKQVKQEIKKVKSYEEK